MNISLEDAISLASQLHKGQTDKAGLPYIMHPLRIMCDKSLVTENERIVAVLHDIVEDCDITLQDLFKKGYSHEVIEAISFLTKTSEEENDYEAFIERIRQGPRLAIKVKIADLRDNSDLTRISKPTEDDIKRTKKYFRALDILEATL